MSFIGFWGWRTNISKYNFNDVQKRWWHCAFCSLPPAGLLRRTMREGQGTSLEAGLRHRPGEKVKKQEQERSGIMAERGRIQTKWTSTFIANRSCLGFQRSQAHLFQLVLRGRRVGYQETEALLLAVPQLPEWPCRCHFAFLPPSYCQRQAYC